MKSFAKITALMMCGLFAFGLAACDSSSDDNTGGGDAGEVVVWGGAEDQTLLASLVEEFKAAYSRRQRNPY